MQILIRHLEFNRVIVYVCSAKQVSVLADLHHPGILTLFGICANGPNLFMVRLFFP